MMTVPAGLATSEVLSVADASSHVGPVGFLGSGGWCGGIQKHLESTMQKEDIWGEVSLRFLIQKGSQWCHESANGLPVLGPETAIEVAQGGGGLDSGSRRGLETGRAGGRSNGGDGGLAAQSGRKTDSGSDHVW